MNICEANLIVKSLLDIPVMNLNTKSFVLIQELKSIYDKMKEDSVNEELQNNFTKLYTEFKQESETFKSSLKNLQNLHTKINLLEKTNKDLLKQINVIQIDNLYLEGSEVYPVYGNCLVYNKNQNYFYILFDSQFVRHTLSFSSKHLLEKNNSEIHGWFFDTKGWRSILKSSITKNELFVSTKIDNHRKNLNGGNKFSILDNRLFKVVIFKNNQTIPIFSNVKFNHISMFNFKNIHQMYVYNSNKFIESFHKEKLLHITNNILQWNINVTDIDNIMSKQYSNINENELLQPLKNDTIILNTNMLDITIWNNLMLLILEYTEICEFGSVNIQSSSYNRILRHQIIQNTKTNIIENAVYIKKYLEETENELYDELEYSKLIQFIKNKKETLKTEIVDLLSKFPVRENLRKIDFFIECLKYDFSVINNLKRLIGKCENNINTFYESLSLIKLPVLQTYPTENFMVDNKMVTIWKNIIIANIDSHFKNKIDTVFNYLIFYNDKIIDRSLKSLIDKLVIEYFTSNNKVKIMHYVNLINEKVKLNIDLDNIHWDSLKNVFYTLVKNENVHLCIKNVNFEMLFSYGIHKILETYQYLVPLHIVYQDSNFYYNNINIFIKDLNIVNNLKNKIIFNTNGLTSGYCTLKYNNYEFSSTTNIFVIEDTKDLKLIPSHFLYSYLVKKKILLLHKNIYNELILNENNFELIGNITEYNSTFYKISIEYFKFLNKIEINNIILKMINGENLNCMYKHFDDIIELQNISYC